MQNILTKKTVYKLLSLAFISTIFSGKIPDYINYVERNDMGLGKTAGVLDDPLLDRAKGYLLHGKVKSATCLSTNLGK